MSSSGSDERRNGTILQIASRDAMEVEMPTHVTCSGDRAGRSNPSPSASGSCPHPPRSRWCAGVRCQTSKRGGIRLELRAALLPPRGRGVQSVFQPESRPKKPLPIVAQPRVIGEVGGQRIAHQAGANGTEARVVTSTLSTDTPNSEAGGLASAASAVGMGPTAGGARRAASHSHAE